MCHLQPRNRQKAAQLVFFEVRPHPRLLREPPSCQLSLRLSLLGLHFPLCLQRLLAQLLPQERLNVLRLLPERLLYQHPGQNMRALPFRLPELYFHNGLLIMYWRVLFEGRQPLPSKL